MVATLQNCFGGTDRSFYHSDGRSILPALDSLRAPGRHSRTPVAATHGRTAADHCIFRDQVVSADAPIQVACAGIASRGRACSRSAGFPFGSVKEVQAVTALRAREIAESLRKKSFAEMAAQRRANREDVDLTDAVGALSRPKVYEIILATVRKRVGEETPISQTNGRLSQSPLPSPSPLLSR